MDHPPRGDPFARPKPLLGLAARRATKLLQTPSGGQRRGPTVTTILIPTYFYRNRQLPNPEFILFGPPEMNKIGEGELLHGNEEDRHPRKREDKACSSPQEPKGFICANDSTVHFGDAKIYQS